MNTRAILATIAVSLAGCRGDLLATAKLSAPGTTETHFAAGKNVALWASFDGKWEAHSYSKYSRPPIEYQIEASQGGSVVAKLSCDTISGGSNSRVCGGFTRVGSSFSGDCEFKMSCQLPDLHEGDVTLKVTGMLPEPERIKEVKDMSLLVRAQ
jgi:hypothetical protein